MKKTTKIIDVFQFISIVLVVFWGILGYIVDAFVNQSRLDALLLKIGIKNYTVLYCVTAVLLIAFSCLCSWFADKSDRKR